MTPGTVQPLRVMLDLETLGTRAGCVILAIGAVTFGNGVIGREFYRRVDAASCVRAGLTIDVETMFWWFRQSDAARHEVAQKGTALPDALSRFTDWMRDGLKTEERLVCELWSKGAAFDIPILDASYLAVGYSRVPWEPFGDRCYRTAAAMHREVSFHRTGTQHNALDDARAQALHLMEIEDYQHRRTFTVNP